MRIKSGGPSGTAATTATQKTQSTKKASGTAFSGLVDKNGSATDDPGQRKSAMMEALADLAKEIEAGKTTGEEASRRFVGMVIEERFGGQKGKGAKNLQDVVAEMVESDPQFVAKLQSQLKRLAKS